MESSQTNPYQAPEAELTTAVTSEPNQSGIFSLSGRIGRLRYLTYFMCIYLIVMVLVAAVGIVAAIAAPELGPDAGGALAVILFIAVYLPMIFYGFVFAVRRLNDCGWSGWVSLLFLVPFANIVVGLLLLFKRGDSDANRFGAQPRPNSTGVKVAAIGGLIIPMAMGMIAAIAVPAYSDYIERAKAAQAQTLQQP